MLAFNQRSCNELSMRFSINQVLLLGDVGVVECRLGLGNATFYSEQASQIDLLIPHSTARDGAPHKKGYRDHSGLISYISPLNHIL